MLIGSSFDADGYDIYIDKETGETIKVDYVFESGSDFYQDYPERYMFLERRVTGYIEEDEWYYAKGFNSEEVSILVECDYCGKSFYLPWKTRRLRATRFLRNFHDGTRDNKRTEKMIDLYKDNCKDCRTKRIQETTMLTQGYWHPTEDDDYRKMMQDVFVKHNLVPTSRGQRYIAKLLGAELNVPVGYYFADIVLDDKIVIEYDGGGHNLSVLKGTMSQAEFDERECQRSETLFAEGYKLVRFISPAELFPEEEQKTRQILCDAIAELYLSDKKEIHISLSNRVNDAVYGKLKPIKDILESSEWGEELL